MSDEPEQVVIPIEQTIISLYAREIVAARLPGGRIAAVLNTLCDALQLDRSGQLQRIRDDEIIAECLISARIETSGGPQAMNVLTAWAIPRWLSGIRLGKVAPEKRPAIRTFQREAADVLYTHFAQHQPALAAPPALVPDEPVHQPSPPGEEAPLAHWLTYYKQMVAWIEWQQDIEQWRGSIESRLESVEEITRLVPELIERLGPATLSPEHQRTVQAGIQRLHEVCGRSHGALYDEMRQHFQVGTYKDIAEVRWVEVMAWFKERFAQAERRANSETTRARSPAQTPLL